MKRESKKIIRSFSDLRGLMYDVSRTSKIPDHLLDEYTELDKAHYDETSWYEIFKVVSPSIIGIILFFSLSIMSSYINSEFLVTTTPDLNETKFHIGLITNKVVPIVQILIIVTILLYMARVVNKMFTFEYIYDFDRALLNKGFRRRCDLFVAKIERSTGYEVINKGALKLKIDGATLSILVGSIAVCAPPLYHIISDYNNPFWYMQSIFGLPIFTQIYSYRRNIVVVRPQ